MTQFLRWHSHDFAVPLLEKGRASDNNISNGFGMRSIGVMRGL